MSADIAALILAVVSFALVAFHARAYSRFVKRVGTWSSRADQRLEALEKPKEPAPAPAVDTFLRLREERDSYRETLQWIVARAARNSPVGVVARDALARFGERAE
jgi:hypothetical protein